MNTMPALFLGHGSPMNAIEADNRFNRGFRQMAARLPKPRAILMISAHWYGDVLPVSGGHTPGMIYDFAGFPDVLRQVCYPAPGSPALAAEVQRLLCPEPVCIDRQRGFDHGTWSVLMHLYPRADVPVVQLGLDRRRSAAAHFALAQKLKPLRQQGVLVVGSGNIVHNLRTLRWAELANAAKAYAWAARFRRDINRAILQHDTDTLIDYARLGEAAALAVPTPEHYWPLLYIMALCDKGETVSLFNDEIVGGSLSMTSVCVGA